MNAMQRAPFLGAALLVYAAGALFVPLVWALLPPPWWPLATYAIYAVIAVFWQRIHASRLKDAGLPLWPSVPLAALVFFFGALLGELAVALYNLAPDDSGAMLMPPYLPFFRLTGALLDAGQAILGSASKIVLSTLTAILLALPPAATLLLAFLPGRRIRPTHKLAG